MNAETIKMLKHTMQNSGVMVCTIALVLADEIVRSSEAFSKLHEMFLGYFDPMNMFF